MIKMLATYNTYLTRMIFCIGCLFPCFTNISGQYSNITTESNVAHTFISSAFVGGGVVFVDYNNDGWEDLVLTGGSQPDRLYLNNTNGTFTDESFKLSKDASSDINVSVVAGDFDNDGCTDLFLSNFIKEGRDLVLRNDCEGNFESIPLSVSEGNEISSMGATLFDFNGDGLLDIYSIGYVDEVNFIYDADGKIIGFDHTCATNRLFINKGDFVFEDNTEAMNAAGLGCGLAVTVIPLQDEETYGIYIANDFGEWIHPNEFLVLKDDDTFEDRAIQYNMDIQMYGMGIAPGDYDNDLDLDLYITNLGENYLLQNNDSIYDPVQNSLNIDNINTPDGRLTTGWGTFFLDADNNSDLDLFVANGTVNSPEFIGGSFNDPNILFIRNNNGNFVQTPESFGIYKEGPNLNRGAAKGDIDNDGDEDIVVSYINFSPTTDLDKQYSVFENNFDQKSYVDIFLEGTISSRNPFGSQVILYSDDNQFLNYLYSGGTHVSQNSIALHFGLNDIEKIDSVKVIWPNFTEEVFLDIPINQRILLTENTGLVDVLGCTELENDLYNPLATINAGCAQTTVSTEDVDADDQFDIRYAQDNNELLITSFIDDITHVSIYDATGRMIHHSREIELIKGSTTSINVENNLLSGMYIVVLDIRRHSTFSEKIIIH